ncbi:MAG: hypothetical protein AB1345_00825 [Chloroflexota bacterium]
MFRNEPQTNEKHDGTIWSKRTRMLYILALTLVLALANFAPALAAGVGWIGK